MSTNYINKITDTGGTTHDIGEGVDTRLFRATCSTAAGTAAKVATLDDSTNYSLAAGVRVAVTFTYGNSATTPTLNVNSGGAKTIVTPTAVATLTSGNGTTYNTWGPYETVIFTYNGTYWVKGGTGYSVYNAYALANSKTANTGTVTKVTAGTGLSIGSTSGGNFTTSGTINHTNSVTAATAGTSSATSGSTLAVPYVTYDAQGHITASGTHTHTISGFLTSSSTLDATKLSGTIPSSCYTDTNTHRPIQMNGTQILGDNTTVLNLKAGSNVSLSNSSGTVTIAATDTTYESKAAASGGTAVSLVTTGEKYTWNNKTSNTGTVTKVTAGTGLSIGSTSGGNFTTTGTINHTNSVTAQTTQAVYPIKIDAQGHISAYGSAVTIPTVNNATLTIQKNGTTVNTFTANASSNVTANITVPTTVSALTNDSGYTTFDTIYPVGSIYCCNSADNPMESIRGSWVLCDIDILPFTSSDTSYFVPSKSTVTNIQVSVGGKQAVVRVNLNTTSALNESSVTLGTFDILSLGFQQIEPVATVAYSDSGNGMAMIAIDSSGTVTCEDVVSKTTASSSASIASGSALVFSVTLTGYGSNSDYNLNPNVSCKYYYKRTN